MRFILDSRLANDTVFIKDLNLCRLLLMNQQDYPWLILVPRLPEVRELFELNRFDQQTCWQEITDVSRLMQQHLNADKMNIAALGNQVAQLHIHVIARFQTDKAWPEPVWGKSRTLYSPSHCDQQQQIWQNVFELLC